MFEGLIDKRPAWLDNRSGCEEAIAEIDGNYSRLLEAAYGKGGTSPTGTDGLQQPIDRWIAA